MKRQLFFLSFLLFALTGMAQSADNSELAITKGVDTINGQNKTYQGYTCHSPLSSWSIAYKNIADSENVRLFYYKTTLDNCVITFPDSTVIPQANGRAGVVVSDRQITLTSSPKGFFLIIIVKDGATYKVSCTQLQG